MTFPQAAGLGAVAGLTILLGLPVARLGRPRPSRMAFLTLASVGVLLFLLYDVIKNASETITGALDTSRAQGIGYGLLLAAGLGTGLMGLLVFERLMKRRRPQMPAGPGALAATIDRPPAARASGRHALSLALAAGPILVVVGELQHVGRKIGAPDVGMLGLLTGFLVAYATDLVLHAAGA